MKRFFNILAAAIICMVLTSPSATAQGRNGRGGTHSSQQKHAPAQSSKSEHGSNGSNNRGNTRPASGGQNHSGQAEHRRPDKSQVHASEAPRTHSGTSAGMPQTKAEKARPSEADRRSNNTNTSRPGNGGYGNNNNATHPGNGNNNSSTRPGNNSGDRPGNGNNSATRPGNNSATRPGNNHGNNHGGPGQPNHGNNHQRPNHPGTPPPPANGFGPGGDRWHGNFHDIPHHAPHRPMLPPPPPHYYRPTPPPAFRPAPNGPRFATILGIALGSAIDFTLNQLFNGGYYVTGYTNNAVYLNDVLMLNLVWPNVTLQYNHGRLIGSEFVYPSAYYNTDVYYQAYNRLQASYGVPVSMNYLSGGGMQASWFGYDGRYVTLTFQGGTAIDGQLRYYTTLSFGN